jgi:hypothetical protein
MSLAAGRTHPLLTVDHLALTANSFRPDTRTIRRHVLSMHSKSVVVAAKIAAAHHARGEFPRLATAFGPTASLDDRSRDRGF